MQIRHVFVVALAAATLSTGASAQGLSYSDIVGAQQAALEAEGYTVVESKRRTFGGAKLEAVGPSGRIEITLNGRGEVVKREFYGSGGATLAAADLPPGVSDDVAAALGGASVAGFEIGRTAFGGTEIEVTGADGSKIERTYDADGRLVKEEITQGGIETETYYGADGSIVKQEVERADDDDDDDDDDDRDDDDDDDDDDDRDDRDDDDDDDDDGDDD